VFSSAWDALILGLLPLGAAVFLGWILAKSLLNAPSTQVWSLVGILIAGVLLMFSARYILHSPFFRMPRESDTPRHARMH
jgi:hypothetical protein